MKQKDLIYLAVAAAAGYYVGHYLVKADGTQSGMGARDQISAHDSARVLGALRAISASQNLRPNTFKLFKSYGVKLTGNGRQGYSYDNEKRWDALSFAGGGGTKTGLAYNLAD